jgi:hypothetical protein
MTQEWTGDARKWHEVYSAISTVKNKSGESIVTAYALMRPDGLWSLLLINKDPNRPYDVAVRFRNSRDKSVRGFGSPIDLFQFSGAQYQLNSDPDNPYPIKSKPPAHVVIGNWNGKIHLPAYSLTVARERKHEID